MSNTTTETVTLTDPDGEEHQVELRVDWSDYQRNPCDKEASRYDGSDDGRTIESVEVV